MAKAALKLSGSNENETSIIEDHAEGELEFGKIFSARLEDGVERPPSRPRSEVNKLLNLVDDLQQNLLDKVLNKAIEEGERFRMWKESCKPLGELQMFHKNNNEFKRIRHYEKLTAFRTLEMTVKLDVSQDSQFEIWCCNKNNELDFPVYRLSFSDIEKDKTFNIYESLREDIALNMKCEIINDSVWIAFSLCTELQSQGCERCARERDGSRDLFPSFPDAFSYIEKKVKPIIEVIWEGGRGGIQYFGNGFATAIVLLILFTISALLIICPQNAKAAEKPTVTYADTRDTDILYDKTLVDRCNKERCKDRM